MSNMQLSACRERNAGYISVLSWAPGFNNSNICKENVRKAGYGVPIAELEGAEHHVRL